MLFPSTIIAFVDGTMRKADEIFDDMIVTDIDLFFGLPKHFQSLEDDVYNYVT